MGKKFSVFMLPIEAERAETRSLEIGGQTLTLTLRAARPYDQFEVTDVAHRLAAMYVPNEDSEAACELPPIGDQVMVATRSACVFAASILVLQTDPAEVDGQDLLLMIHNREVLAWLTKFRDDADRGFEKVKRPLAQTPPDAPDEP